MTDEIEGDHYKRVMEFSDNSEKYMTIDGIDYSKSGVIEVGGTVVQVPEYEMEIGGIIAFAPEFLSKDNLDAIEFRKKLRAMCNRLDTEGWWQWVQEVDLQMTANTISAGHWLSILSSLSNYLARYDDYVKDNKSWFTVDSVPKKDALDSLISKSVALRYALRNEVLPEIPKLYHFMSCGNIMFVSKHHQKLNKFCRDNGAKALYDDSMVDMLERFESFLEGKKIEHVGTTIKGGNRRERELASRLVKMLHDDLFREKLRPIALITLIINIRYKKSYSRGTISDWLRN